MDDIEIMDEIEALMDNLLRGGGYNPDTAIVRVRYRTLYAFINNLLHANPVLTKEQMVRDFLAFVRKQLH